MLYSQPAIVQKRGLKHAKHTCHFTSAVCRSQSGWGSQDDELPPKDFEHSGILVTPGFMSLDGKTTPPPPLSGIYMYCGPCILIPVHPFSQQNILLN